jgi:hypothetical protein
MSKARARSLDDRIGDSIDLMKSIAYSQNILVEQQEQLIVSHSATANLLKDMNINLFTVMNTTDTILGVSRRIESMVSAYSKGSYLSILTQALFDPWCVLYAYIILHPVAPVPLEYFASTWQFVLLLYRIPLVREDCKSSIALLPTLSGSLTLYFTSPYKAIYCLYWLNRQFVYGVAAAAAAAAAQQTEFQIVLREPSCPYEPPKLLVCYAENGLQTILESIRFVGSYVYTSGIATHALMLFDMERAIFGGLLAAMYMAIVRWMCSFLPFKMGACRGT